MHISKKFQRFIFSSSIIIYSIFVTYYWFADNNYFTKIIIKEKIFGLFLIFNISFPFWVGFIFSILLLLYSIFQKKKYIISFKKSYFFLFLLMYLYITILYILSVYLRLLFPSLEPALTGKNFIPQITIFFTTLTSQIIWLILFSSIIYLSGEFITKLLLKKKLLSHYDNYTKILLNFLFGLIFLTLTSFVLASTSLFNAVSISIIFFIIAFVQKNSIIQFLKFFFSKRNFTFSMKKIFTWIVILTLISFSIFLIGSLIPSPQGFDSSTEYLNRANLIATHGQLMPGTYPYAYSLLVAIGYLFSGNAMYSFGINLIFSILGLTTLFKVIHLLTKDKTISLSLATLWLTLPLTTTYLHYEAKVELFLFFISSISILLFIYYIKNPKNHYTIYLIAFILGFAFTVKVIAIFLVIALFIPILYIIYKNFPIKKVFSIVFLIFIFSMISILPWSIHALYTTIQSKEPMTLTSLVKSTNINNAIIPFDNSDCINKTTEDDYIRFKINVPNPLLKPLIIPWNLMRNSTFSVDRNLVNIGYIPTLFYYLFFVFLIYFIFTKKQNNKKITILIFSTIIFWILWSFLAKDIIWYGYAGFTLYFILIGLLLKQIKTTNTPIYLFIISLIVLNTTMHILEKSRTFLPKRQIGYLSFGTYIKLNDSIVKILNKPENITSKIYMQSIAIIYDIKDSHKRIVKDTMLSQFSCIMQKTDNDFDFMLDYLQQNNITYVISFNSEAIENSHNRIATYEKLSLFKKFTEEKLILVKKGIIISLYKVPTK